MLLRHISVAMDAHHFLTLNPMAMGHTAYELPGLQGRGVGAGALGGEPGTHPHHVPQVPPRADWGWDRILGGEKAKLEFRHRINDENPRHPKDNVLKPISTKSIFTKACSRRFARRRREYRRVYTATVPEHDVERFSKEHGRAEGFQSAEKMRKRRNAHCNIVDMEVSFLNAN